MDVWTLIIAAAAAAAAIAGAIVAIVQARRASSSESDAVAARDEAKAARDESVRLAALATDAFIRQAEAQEKANAMREDELRPPAWTGPVYVVGDTYRVVNSSGQTLIIESFDVKPDGSEGLINIDGKEDGVYEYGDAFTYLTSRRLTSRGPQKLTVFWRYQDSPEDERHAFIIPL